MYSHVCWCCYVGRYLTSVSVCRVVWRVSLRCLGCIEGWVHWSSANRSISYVVVVVVVPAFRKTPNTSSTYFCCMLVIIVWYVPDCPIRVCYWGCVMRMLRQGYLFLYFLHVQCKLLLCYFQFGPCKTYCMFCIVIYTYRIIRNNCRVLTTCHGQYAWVFLFLTNRTTLQIFVTHLTGALYVHPFWFYKHQHDNRVRSKLTSC